MEGDHYESVGAGPEELVGRSPTVRPAVRADRIVFTVVGLAYGIFLLVSWLSQWGLADLLYYSGLGARMGGFYTIVLSVVPMYLIGLPVCLLFLRLLPRSRREGGRLGVGGGLAAFFICIFVMYAGNLIGTALMAAASAASGREIINPVEEMVTDNYVWVNVVLAVLAAPLGEEFLYRRELIDRVGQYGEGVAVVLSGLLFGLSHGNFFQFFYAFALGTVFGCIYYRTGKLRYSVGLHMLINFMGSVVPLWVLRQGGYVVSVYGILVLLFLLIGLVCLIVCRRRIHLNQGSVYIPRGKRFWTVCGNVGMAFFFLVATASFAINIWLS